MARERTVTKSQEFPDGARELAESILNTVREPLIVLDQDLEGCHRQLFLL